MDTLKIVRTDKKVTGGRRGPGRLELVLIIYDTEAVRRITTREDMQWNAANLPDVVIEVPKKYAVVLVGRDDSNMIAQVQATRRHSHAGEWADDWSELPEAIQRLRARHPNEPFPDEIDYVIDWPYNRSRPRPKQGT